MYYPVNLLGKDINIYPIFGDQLQGEPYWLDLSSSNPNICDYRTDDFDIFQRQVFKELAESGSQWGIAKYLEERQALLSAFSQMVKEKRFYHVGLDIIVPAGVPLYAPLASSVYQIGIDAGQGNYGGYVILAHEVNGVRFYSFYGHLNSDHQVMQGDRLEAGQQFGLIGEKADSGYWFTHTHMQILTERAVNEGRLTQGYITESEVLTVDQWFPSPYPLFRW